MGNLVFSPGFYTKLRIDDEGQIVDVDNLQAEDLPQHNHSLKDLDKNELTDVVAEVLSTFFANNGDCAVKFIYDKNTKTVSADVDIDEETIQKNEYGQLISVISTSTEFRSESSTNSSSVDTEDISNQLETFRDQIPDLVLQTLSQIFANNQNAAVVFTWDKYTKTFSADLRYDGISINKDENGDLVATGAVPGDGGNCASHTHTADQIEDLEEFVKTIFNNYSKNININIANFIDGETIKLNEYGQLVAVRTALEKHTHVLEDIIDYVAPDPAAKQKMSDLGDPEDVDYDSGVIDFSRLNIGYSILAISQYLKDVVGVSIDKLTKRLDNLVFEGDNPGTAILSMHPVAIKNDLYDKQTENYREVYYSSSAYLSLDYLPYNEGKVSLVVNGSTVATANIEELIYENQKSGVFQVEKVYKKNAYTARILKIDAHSFLKKENIYTLQLKFYQADNSSDATNTVTIAACPYAKLAYTFTDTSDTHKINGITYYDYTKSKTYEIVVNDFENHRFVPYGMRYGKIEGIAEKSFKLVASNLWYDTEIEVNFDLQTEHSDCWLAKHLQAVQSGSIINNKLVPFGNCIASFGIPNSTLANAIQITGDLDLTKVVIKKGNLTAYGANIAETGIRGGRLPMSNIKIVALEGYDPGTEPIRFLIETTDTVDLENIEISCLAC